ncbi:MAG: hypothetical protein ACREBV_08970, partial [Candidatus Zixiibacteriota bacterium]
MPAGVRNDGSGYILALQTLVYVSVSLSSTSWPLFTYLRKGMPNSARSFLLSSSLRAVVENVIF